MRDCVVAYVAGGWEEDLDISLPGSKQHTVECGPSAEKSREAYPLLVGRCLCTGVVACGGRLPKTQKSVCVFELTWREHQNLCKHSMCVWRGLILPDSRS